MLNKIQHYIWQPWLVVFCLSLLPIFDYTLISFNSLLLVIFYFLFMSLGIVLADLSPRINSTVKLKFNANHVGILIGIVAFLSSLIGLNEVLKNLKFTDLLSITSLTDSRFENRSFEAGSNFSIFRFMGQFTSGFSYLVLIFLLYSRFHNIKIRKKIFYFLFLVLVLSFFLLISSGGRNSLGIYLISIFVFYKIHSKNEFKVKNFKFLKQIKRLGIFFFLFFFMFIMAVTITRNQLKTENISYSNRSYYANGFGVKINPDILDKIDHTSIGENVYGPLVILHYYSTHSLHEMNRTLNSSPDDFPYYGGYQFYTVTLFFKKLGFNVVDINEILTQIVNRGKYFSLIGAAYLDFGYACIFYFFLIGFLMKRAYLRYIRFHSFIACTQLTFLTIIVLLAPFYSVVGIGVGSAITVAILTISFFNKKFELVLK